MNPLAFLVNAYLTVPFLAACAWAQCLDEAEHILEDINLTSVPQTNLTTRKEHTNDEG